MCPRHGLIQEDRSSHRFAVKFFIDEEERLCGLLECRADAVGKGVVPDQAAVRDERPAVNVLMEVTKQVEVWSPRVVDVPVGDLLVDGNRDAAHPAAVTDSVAVMSAKLEGPREQIVRAVIAVSNAPFNAVAVF